MRFISEYAVFVNKCSLVTSSCFEPVHQIKTINLNRLLIHLSLEDHHIFSAKNRDTGQSQDIISLPDVDTRKKKADISGVFLRFGCQ